MSKITATIRLSLCAIALSAVAACSNIDRKHGYVPPDEDLQQIVVGVDTVETVGDLIGRPSTSGILSDSGWYYVESQFRVYGIRESTEIDRQVVAISFDDKGVVENVERFGLEDGKVIAISRRVTDSNIKGITFIRQLFGSVGNFAAEQLLAN